MPKLWSHLVAQSPSNDPDVQEALSRRYGNDVIILLPLKSQRIAVFNASRQLCGFVDPLLNREEIWVSICEAWQPPESDWNTQHVSDAAKKVDPSDMEFL